MISLTFFIAIKLVRRPASIRLKCVVAWLSIVASAQTTTSATTSSSEPLLTPLIGMSRVVPAKKMPLSLFRSRSSTAGSFANWIGDQHAQQEYRNCDFDPAWAGRIEAHCMRWGRDVRVRLSTCNRYRPRTGSSPFVGSGRPCPGVGRRSTPTGIRNPALTAFETFPP